MASKAKELQVHDFLPKGMPQISFLPGIDDEENIDSDDLEILYEIHSVEKKQMVAFRHKLHEEAKAEKDNYFTRSKKRDRESENIPPEDLPDDKSTYGDAMWSSFECRKKLKAKEKELSSSSAARDFIQQCEEDQEYLHWLSTQK